MPTHVFNEAKEDILAAYLAAIDARIALLMTNTTADTENDGIVNVDDITTLDELDSGASYMRKPLASGAVTKDDANDRANLDFDDVTWTALAPGTRSIAGVLLYDHVTNDADSKVIAWLEFATPKTPDGSDFTLNIADLLRLS